MPVSVSCEPSRWRLADGDVEMGLSPVEVLKERAVDLFAAEGWTPCHAAAAEIDGRLVVFPGASGVGKSTLAVLLALRGHAVADDLVFLREVAGSVEAAVPPVPLSMSEEALRALPAAASWRLPRSGPPGGKILLKPPALLARVGEVAAVVLLRRGAARAGISLRPAARGEAARLLLKNIARHSGGGSEYAARRRRTWETFCALLDRVPAFVFCGDLLSYAEDALGRIESLVAELTGGGRHV